MLHLSVNSTSRFGFVAMLTYKDKDKDKDTFIGPQEFVVHMTI